MPKLSPDEKWRCLHKKLRDYMKKNDFLGMGLTYYEMADFLVSEGRDPKQQRELGYKMKLIFQKGELKGMKQSQEVKGVEVLADSTSCGYCLKMDGKVFSIDNALKENPLPVERCTYKYGCRCTYLPVME